MKKLCWKCLGLPEEATLSRKDKIVHSLAEALKKEKPGVDTSPGTFIRSLLDAMGTVMEDEYKAIDKVLDLIAAAQMQKQDLPPPPAIVPAPYWYPYGDTYIGDPVPVEWPYITTAGTLYPTGSTFTITTSSGNTSTYTTDNNFFFTLTDTTSNLDKK